MIIRAEELEGITVKHNNNVVKIVYAAAGSHAALFDEYVKPIVPELVREFGDKISFSFVGVRPNMEDLECEYISGMPLMEYRKFMREQNFDIGLAPLHVNDFSKCKYFNKFVEYTIQGIAGVYSNTEPYTYVVTNGENGFLASNRPEDWLNAMRRAIKDNKLREQCIANAIDYLRDRHSEEAIIGRFIEEFPEAAKNMRTYDRCKNFTFQKVKYAFSRPLDWLYLTGFYMKRTGIKDVLDRAKRKALGSNVNSR